MDMSQYLELFIEESKEHLQNLNQNLLMLEKYPSEITTLNEIFRSAHTLKGIAGTMGFSNITKLTHDMESVLQIIRNGELSVTSNIVDLLFRCLDALENYINSIVETGSEGNEKYEELIDELGKISSKKTASEVKVKGEAKEVKKASARKNDKTEAKEQKEENLSDILIDGSLKDILKQKPSEEEDVEKEEIDKETSKISNINNTNEVPDYKINVKLNSGCLLKAARAYIVFQILEKHCKVITSIPSIADIEDEKFDFEFSVDVVTDVSKELLLKELNSIAEIENIEIEQVSQKSDKVQPTNEEKDDSIQGTAAFVKNITKINKLEEEKSKDNAANVIKPRTGKTVRVDIDRLDNLMNLVSELIIVKTTLDGINYKEGTTSFNDSIEYLERVTTNLHDAVMKVRMVPVEMVFNRFPRMIRDLSKELGKEIILNMSGEETEIDRTVVDELGDPLIHLLRNSADHGIEGPVKRKATGKPEAGTINLRAYQSGNNVVIEVEDDGQGINIEKARRKIIEKGLLSDDAANNLEDKEVINYLFKPSFSTADKITDVSGRGVGLDVVRTKISALGGTVDVETSLGNGSKFIIRLPLTLAIIQALLVVVGQEKYAIPLSSIKEIINAEEKDIQVVQNQEVFMLRNQIIPITRLKDMLDVPDADKINSLLTIVIIKRGDKLSGVIVDELIGQQEIVIKSLGKYLSGIHSIAGATILGDGQVALIFDVNSLA